MMVAGCPHRFLNITIYDLNHHTIDIEIELRFNRIGNGGKVIDELLIEP